MTRRLLHQRFVQQFLQFESGIVLSLSLILPGNAVAETPPASCLLLHLSRHPTGKLFLQGTANTGLNIWRKSAECWSENRKVWAFGFRFKFSSCYLIRKDSSSSFCWIYWRSQQYFWSSSKRVKIWKTLLMTYFFNYFYFNSYLDDFWMVSRKMF